MSVLIVLSPTRTESRDEILFRGGGLSRPEIHNCVF
jgi:hypothetical protein